MAQEILVPVPAFKFNIEIQSIIEGMFTSCSGLGMKRKVLQYKEGGVNHYTHQLPDRISFNNLKLERGIGSPKLFQWCMTGAYDGKVSYTNISIILFGFTKNGPEVVQRWDVQRAYPIAWTGPTLKTSSKNVAIETLQIAHHGLRLVT